MPAIQIAHNAVVAKLINPSDALAQKVSDLLSYAVEGSDKMFSVNVGRWDGRSTFYDFANHTFPAGFVFLVHSELKRMGHTVHLIFKKLSEVAPPLGPENPIVDAFGNDDPRYDYQMRALRQVEKHGRGIIQVATGGGKSKIAKLIMARYRRMTLFLTTRGILLYQMDDQLRDIGLNTGQIGDGEFKVVRGVNLGMVQTFAAAVEEPDIEAEHRAIVASLHRSKKREQEANTLTHKQIRELAEKRFNEKAKRREKILKLLEMIEVVVGEEAHEAGGNSYFKILQHCKNAHIRVALTATPFMRDSAEDNMRLMAAFGPVLIKISEEMLIERGILAKPYFKFVNSAPHEKLRRTSPWERAYKLGYLENMNMHKDILRDGLKAARAGLPVLTLVLRKEHGATIRKLYEKVGLRAAFMKGENDQAERKRYLSMLAAGELDVLIGTTIVDVGVDVPAIGLVQLAGGGKAEVALRQRIGRALRAKKFGPNVAFVAVYSCDMNGSLADHSRQRRRVIEATPGFVEGILPANDDFPWHLFNKRKAA